MQKRQITNEIHSKILCTCHKLTSIDYEKLLINTSELNKKEIYKELQSLQLSFFNNFDYFANYDKELYTKVFYNTIKFNRKSKD